MKKNARPAHSDFDALFNELVEQAEVLVQEYRVELFWIAATAAAWAALRIFLRLTSTTALGAVAILWMMILAFPWTRTYVIENLFASDMRRRWDQSVRHCNLPHRIPLSKLERVSTGYRGRIRVGRGIAFTDLEMRREKLTAAMALRDIVFFRDSDNAQTGLITFVKIDPLADPIEAASPLHEREQPRRRRPPQGYGPFDNPPPFEPPPPRRPRTPSPEPPNNNGGEGIWRPIPVGLNEHGDIVSIALPERNLLLGGVPDSGKSVAASQLLAAAALDPNVHIWLIDWKGVELQEWERCATQVAQSPAEAIALCQRLFQVMKTSYERMREMNAKKIHPSLEDLPLHCLFIDELSPYTDGASRTQNNEFTSLLTELVGRGRAAGIMTCAATQKPEATVVPTKLRDLFVYRWAMRCMTPEASDTILGRGMAARGFSAVDIADDKPGVGYLLAEGRLPVRTRSFYLQDAEIRSLAERAYSGRNDGYSVRR